MEMHPDQLPDTELAIIAEPVSMTAGVILVIDDEESVRNVVSRIIQHLGYTPLLAEDGTIGIELFHSHTDVIKCVLLDLAMPNLGGVQVFHAIRQIQSDARVLLMSGYSEQEIASSINGIDQQDIISKPFSLDVLRNRLQHMLIPE
jgi:CheY-like chemotaxis protein